jgi:beta-lactamase class A
LEETVTMEELVKQMNTLCDALPFQTSWHLKDLKTGKAANRLGDTPVPSASTRASRATIRASLASIPAATM